VSILNLLAELFSELNPKLPITEVNCLERDNSGQCNHKLVIRIGSEFETILHLNGDTAHSKFDDKVLQNEVNKKFLKFITYFNKDTKKRFGTIEATPEGIKAYSEFNGR